MKRKLSSWFGAVAVLLVLGSQPLKAITLDYSSLVGANIAFDGSSHFKFNPNGTGFSANITSSDGSGDSIGDLLKMTIGGSGWTIGTVSTFGAVQTASVTGSGTLTIKDHAGAFLTATLVWLDITSVGTQDGLNVGGTANLSSITYAGLETDLLALANGTSPTDVLSFSFTPSHNVAYLKSHSITDSFSGQLSAVPDGGLTVAFLGFALVSVEGLRRKLRK